MALNLKSNGVLIEEYDLRYNEGLYDGYYSGHDWVYFYDGNIYTHRYNTNGLIYTGPTHETWLSIADVNIDDKWEEYFQWYLYEGDNDDNKEVADLYQKVKQMIKVYNDLKDTMPWSNLKIKLDEIIKGAQVND